VGSALYPFNGAYGPCGINQTESITWYKDGVKLATITFDASGNPISYVAEPGQKMPTWLTSGATAGILVIGIEGQGTYTSVVKCFNGSTYGSTTVANAAPKNYKYYSELYSDYGTLDGNYNWFLISYVSIGVPHWDNSNGVPGTSGYGCVGLRDPIWPDGELPCATNLIGTYPGVLLRVVAIYDNTTNELVYP
jgi:hypothetical protein